MKTLLCKYILYLLHENGTYAEWCQTIVISNNIYSFDVKGNLTANIAAEGGIRLYTKSQDSK